MALHRMEVDLEEHPWEEDETYYGFCERVLAELGLSGTASPDNLPPFREVAMAEAGKVTLIFWLPVIPPALRYVKFAGLGNTWVKVDANDVAHVAPLETGTRITMSNGVHFDVPALRDEVEAKLKGDEAEADRFKGKQFWASAKKQLEEAMSDD